MINTLKAKAIAFRYWAARTKPSLEKTLENKDFEMATYILQNKPETVTEQDLSFGTHFMLPGTSVYSYAEKRTESMKFLNALLETDFAEKVPARNLGSLIHRASIELDAEMLKTLFKFPQSLDIDRDAFGKHTYYFFVPEDDPRRTAYDSRPCDLHQPAGYPELLKITEDFDKERKKRWKVKQIVRKRTARKTRKTKGVRSPNE